MLKNMSAVYSLGIIAQVKPQTLGLKYLSAEIGSAVMISQGSGRDFVIQYFQPASRILTGRKVVDDFIL